MEHGFGRGCRCRSHPFHLQFVGRCAGNAAPIFLFFLQSVHATNITRQKVFYCPKKMNTVCYSPNLNINARRMLLAFMLWENRKAVETVVRSDFGRFRLVGKDDRVMVVMSSVEDHGRVVQQTVQLRRTIPKSWERALSSAETISMMYGCCQTLKGILEVSVGGDSRMRRVSNIPVRVTSAL